MRETQELLSNIKRHLKNRTFRLRIHAARHLIEEGFTEENILAAVLGKSKILEHYPEESRLSNRWLFSLE